MVKAIATSTHNHQTPSLWPTLRSMLPPTVLHVPPMALFNTPSSSSREKPVVEPAFEPTLASAIWSAQYPAIEHVWRGSEHVVAAGAGAAGGCSTSLTPDDGRGGRVVRRKSAGGRRHWNPRCRSNFIYLCTIPMRG